MDIETLGVTKEEITKLVVDKLVNQFLGKEEGARDEDGFRSSVESRLIRAIDDKIKCSITEAVDARWQQPIEEAVAKAVESTAFAETSRYGEPKKPPLTWREFLADRAEKYLLEQVDCDGKPTNGYSNRYESTRAAQLVYKYMGVELHDRMVKVMALANEQIVGGLKKAVDQKLDQIKVALTAH